MQNLLKVLLLLILFAPALCFAFKQKKWYLYLACAFIGILPSQFAIELSPGLPLLTAERILILIMLGFWLCKKWKEKTFTFPIALLVYCGMNILISLLNLNFGITGEIKRVCILLLEQVLLVIMLADLIGDREELENCIDSVILGCCALSVIGIMQTIFDFDMTTVLNLVDARSDTVLTQRMEMTRAFGTSNAIMFGCYCAFTSLLIYYRLDRTGKLWYSFAFALDIAALICTFSRSAWLCFAAAGCVLLLIRPRKLACSLWKGGVITVVLCLLLTCMNTGFAAAFTETGKSTLNTVLSVVNIQLPTVNDPSETPDTPDPTKPSQPQDPDEEIFQFDLSEKFGLNANSAALSRFVEWTSLLYMFEEGHGFSGYGYDAFKEGRLHYFYPQFGFWIVAGTLDVGLLRIATEAGILGLVVYLSFLAFVFISAFRRRGEKGVLTFNKLLLYLIPMYLLLNFMAAFSSLLWTLIGLFYAYKRICNNGMKDREILTLSFKHR